MLLKEVLEEYESEGWRKSWAWQDKQEAEKRKKQTEELAWLLLLQKNLNKKPKSEDRDAKLKEVEDKIAKIPSHYKSKAEEIMAKITVDINKPVDVARKEISRKYDYFARQEISDLDKKFPVGRDCSDNTLRPEAEQSAKEVGADVETVFKKIKADCEKQHKAETQKPPSLLQRAKTAIGLEESLKLVIKQTIKETLRKH